MSELSTIKGISYSDWQSYLLWVEQGSPTDWLDYKTGVYALCAGYSHECSKKWGTEL